MSAPNDGQGSSIARTNQLLIQTLLALQKHNRQKQERPVVAVPADSSSLGESIRSGGLGRNLGERPFAQSARSDAIGHFASFQNTQLRVSHQPTQHFHALEHQVPAQQYMNMCQLGPLSSQQQNASLQMYPPINMNEIFAHRHFLQVQQQASHPANKQYLSATHPGVGGESGGDANSAVDGGQGAGSGSGSLRLDSASCLPGPGIATDEFESHPPCKRARGASPSGLDKTKLVDGLGASKAAAQNNRSWDEDFVTAAVFVPRVQTVWSPAVCPVSAHELKKMRKRVQAIVQGKCLPPETSTGTRAKADRAVNRRKSTGKIVNRQNRGFKLSADVCPPSKTGKEESTGHASDSGPKSVPERTIGCSGVSESTESGTCSGFDNGDGHGSNTSESYGADSRNDSMSNGSDNYAADSSQRGCRSNGSESDSADSGGDCRSNTSESGSGDRGGDSHDLVSESNWGECGTSHESSGNDGVGDGGSSIGSGTREGSSERCSEIIWTGA